MFHNSVLFKNSGPLGLETVSFSLIFSNEFSNTYDFLRSPYNLMILQHFLIKRQHTVCYHTQNFYLIGQCTVLVIRIEDF